MPTGRRCERSCGGWCRWPRSEGWRFRMRVRIAHRTSPLIALVVWLHRDGSTATAGLCVCCQKSMIGNVVACPTARTHRTGSSIWRDWNRSRRRHVLPALLLRGTALDPVSLKGPVVRVPALVPNGRMFADVSCIGKTPVKGRPSAILSFCFMRSVIMVAAAITVNFRS